jgi:hypothetical protein
MTLLEISDMYLIGFVIFSQYLLIFRSMSFQKDINAKGKLHFARGCRTWFTCPVAPLSEHKRRDTPGRSIWRCRTSRRSGAPRGWQRQCKSSLELSLPGANYRSVTPTQGGIRGILNSPRPFVFLLGCWEDLGFGSMRNTLGCGNHLPARQTQF